MTLLQAPWINVSGVGDGLVDELLVQFAEVFGTGAKNVFGRITDWFITIDLFSFNEGSPLLGQPKSCGNDATCTALQDIYGSVFFGEITGLAIVLLFLSVYSQSAMSIFGLGSRRGYLRTNRKALTAFMLIVMWYPIAVGFVGIVDALTIQLVPDLADFGNTMSSYAPGPSISNASGDVDLLTLVMVTLSGVLAIALQLLFQVRLVAILTLLYAGPIVIVARYSGVDALENVGRRTLAVFVGLVLMPLGVGLVMGLFDAVGFTDLLDVFESSSNSEGVVVLSFEVTALYVAWKLIGFTDPVSRVPTAAQPVVEAIERPGRSDEVTVRHEGDPGGAPGGADPSAAGPGRSLRRTANDPGDRR